MLGTALQEDVGKTAGGRADIHGDGADRIEAEVIESVRQFDPATTYPRMIAPAHVDVRVDGKLLSRLR